MFPFFLGTISALASVVVTGENGLESGPILAASVSSFFMVFVLSSFTLRRVEVWRRRRKR